MINRTIRDVIVAALAALRIDASKIDNSTELLSVGLVDSAALLDIILEVEQSCKVQFDAERIDFEHALTLDRLVSSFVALE
jgi:acyl carrier protein